MEFILKPKKIWKQPLILFVSVLFVVTIVRLRTNFSPRELLNNSTKRYKNDTVIKISCICSISDNEKLLDISLALHLALMLESIFVETKDVAININILAFPRDYTMFLEGLQPLLKQAKRNNIEASLSFTSLDRVFEEFSTEISLHRKFYSNATFSPKFLLPHFYLRPLLHRIFPEYDKIMALDLDLEFRVDIRDLYSEFSAMTEFQAIAMAYEQAPHYRNTLKRYREKNPGTIVGDYRPGYQGFNDGLVLLDLDKLRKNRKYQYYFTEDASLLLQKKYEMEVVVADQDFYTLLGIEEPNLFRVLDCSWNRQLSRDYAHDPDFCHYRICDGPAKIFHGNSNSPLPTS